MFPSHAAPSVAEGKDRGRKSAAVSLPASFVFQPFLCSWKPAGSWGLDSARARRPRVPPPPRGISLRSHPEVCSSSARGSSGEGRGARGVGMPLHGGEALRAAHLVTPKPGPAGEVLVRNTGRVPTPQACPKVRPSPLGRCRLFWPGRWPEGSGGAVSFLTPTGAQTRAVFVSLRQPALPCVGAGGDHEREHLAARPPLPADVSHL